MFLIEQPYKTYTDLNGKPINDGSVYIGVANSNPVTSPVTVYWDAAGTQPASQPLDVMNGYIVRAGTPANVFVATSYSILIKDSRGRQVFYARTSDDFSVIATIIAFITSLASSIGSSLVGYIQAGVGAILRTVRDRLRDRVSVFDFMSQAQRDDVRAFTYLLDVTAALQAAYTYAASIGATAWHPGGGYKIVPATVFADEDGSYDTYAAFLMKSNLHVSGEPGVVFKVGDNVSTDAAPKSMGIFCTNEVLSNISIRNIDFDMNGANNLISPLRPVTYRHYNQSPILVSGTPAGVAARIDDMAVDYCTFRNNPGVCDIVVAQSNSPGIILGKRWRMCFNKFINNGLDTDDHTAVFAWADDVLFFGNEYSQNIKYAQIGRTGGNTCYEIHGSRHRLIGNDFQNYYRGIWVSSNLTAAECLDSIIANNNFFTHFYGVDFFRSLGTLSQPRNTIITGNTFRFDDYTIAAPVPQQKSVINVASEYAQRDILIEGNQALSTDNVVGSVFLTVAPQTVAGQAHSNVTCQGNKARGFVIGVNIRTNATNGLGFISIQDNAWEEGITTAAFTIPIGVFVDPVSAITTLVISDNRMVDERGSPPLQYGVYIQPGAITDLYYSGNYCKGLAGGADYYETGTVTGTKHGFFDNITITPVFKSSGVAFTLGDGTSAGRYTIQGKQITYNASITLGATSVVPVGNLSLTLPIAVGSHSVQYLGGWRIFDNSASTFTFGTIEADPGGTEATFQVSGGTFVTNASPIALATSDKISAQITYTRA